MILEGETEQVWARRRARRRFKSRSNAPQIFPMWALSLCKAAAKSGQLWAAWLAAQREGCARARTLARGALTAWQGRCC